MSFCYIDAFLGDIHRELLFLDIKESRGSLLFLPRLKMPNSEKNLYLFKQLFLIKRLKGDKY